MADSEKSKQDEISLLEKKLGASNTVQGQLESKLGLLSAIEDELKLRIQGFEEGTQLKAIEIQQLENQCKKVQAENMLIKAELKEQVNLACQRLADWQSDSRDKTTQISDQKKRVQMLEGALDSKCQTLEEKTIENTQIKKKAGELQRDLQSRLDQKGEEIQTLESFLKNLDFELSVRCKQLNEVT